MKVKHLIEELEELKSDDRVAACIWGEEAVKDHAKGINYFITNDDLSDDEIYDVLNELEDRLGEAASVIAYNLIFNKVTSRR